jgi:hypothetical protein
MPNGTGGPLKQRGLAFKDVMSETAFLGHVLALLLP